MSDHPLSSMVRDYYNKLDADTSFVCRLNDHDLTPEQAQTFRQLSADVTNRYYGSGFSIPELLEGKRILDIGSGSGSMVFLLSKYVGPSGYVVGIDLTDQLVKRAQSLVDHHTKQWGYSKPNCEFRVLNAEKLDQAGFEPNSFDIIVSNGVFCLMPNKEIVFKNAFGLLKEGGQFYLNDVNREADYPEENRENRTLWALGVAGSMHWKSVAPMVKAAGYTTPYLTSAGPVDIASEKYRQMLANVRFACVGWRLFKLPPGASKPASRVTYLGNIPGFQDAFPWDIDLVFKKGEGVEVDAELATILAHSYLKDSFTFSPASGNPSTNRNQNPFVYMDKLSSQGKLPDPIYKIE